MMEFNGTFEIEGVSTEEIWLALSDPVMIESALPGCQFLIEIDESDPDFAELRDRAEAADDPPTLPEADPEDVADRAFREGDRYAALMEIGVGSVNSTFEAIVTMTKREFPEMHAEGEGDSSNSAFEMESGMTIVETDDGAKVEWWAESNVFGRIAQMGQRVINPVANRIINRFFNRIATQLEEFDEDETELSDRIRNLVGIRSDSS